MESVRREMENMRTLWLLLLLLLMGAVLGVSAQPPTSAPAPELPVSPPAASPTRPPAAVNDTPVDPAQLSALEQLGVTVTGNPCITQTDIVDCDSATPYRHILRLLLQLCSTGDVPADALRPLGTSLKTLEFVNCPFNSVAVPPEVLASVTKLVVKESLGRLPGGSVNVSGLSSVWLYKWYNLVELQVQDVVVITNDFAFIISNMTHLEALTFTQTSVPGGLADVRWPVNLTSLDLSFNSLNGSIPDQLGARSKLQSIDLSDNKLSGAIPPSLGLLPNLNVLALANNFLVSGIPTTFSGLDNLMTLDVSGNQLNGTLPSFLNDLPGLRNLDVRNNTFEGPIPFNSTTIKEVALQTAGNPELCYNSSSLKAADVSLLVPCGPDGLPPIPSPFPFLGEPSPAPAPESAANSGASHHKKKGPKTIVIAVAASLGVIIIFIVVVILISRCCSREKD